VGEIVGEIYAHGSGTFLGLYASDRNGWIADNSDQIAGGEERKEVPLIARLPATP
jgi:hypothetical protein